MFIVDEGHRLKDLGQYRTWTGKSEKRDATGLMISTAGVPGSDFENTREAFRQGATKVTRRGQCYARYETRDEVVNTRHYPSVGAALSIFSHDRLVSPPGAAFNYSSYGWNLLGVALARAAHTSFPALVERELGLHRAFVDSTRYYELADDGRAVPAPRVDLSDRLPSGGFRASAADVARVVSKLAPPHARLLFTPQRTRDGTSTDYGLGWEVHGPFVGHTGSVVGGTAAVILHVKSGVALALATNVGTVTAASPPAPPPGTPDPPQLLLPFLGR